MAGDVVAVPVLQGGAREADTEDGVRRVVPVEVPRLAVRNDSLDEGVREDDPRDGDRDGGKGSVVGVDADTGSLKWAPTSPFGLTLTLGTGGDHALPVSRHSPGGRTEVGTVSETRGRREDIERDPTGER